MHADRCFRRFPANEVFEVTAPRGYLPKKYNTLPLHPSCDNARTETSEPRHFVRDLREGYDIQAVALDQEELLRWEGLRVAWKR